MGLILILWRQCVSSLQIISFIYVSLSYSRLTWGSLGITLLNLSPFKRITPKAITDVVAPIMAAGSDGLSIYIPKKKKKKNYDYELNVYLKKAFIYTGT